MDGAGYTRKLKRIEGLRRLYRELGLENPNHPFVDTYMDKAISHLGKTHTGLFQQYVIESLYVEGKTPEQTAGPRGIPISAVETVRKEAIERLRNLCRYPWLL